MDINELQKERFKLRTKIREWYRKGKNAKELVLKLMEVQNELIKLGVSATNKKDYLTLEFWDKFEGNEPTKPIKAQQIPQLIEEPPIKPIQDSFILCLAWTAGPQNETPEQVKKVQDYFNELGLPIIDEEVSDTHDRLEHVLRYEFNVSEKSFRLLKMCTQFVLDAFAKTDFEKFNIAIYGKKKKY